MKVSLLSLIFWQEVKAVFELGDADRDGEIDLDEFIAVMTTSSPVPYTVGSFFHVVKVGR
jgi:hypothetical protein